MACRYLRAACRGLGRSGPGASWAPRLGGGGRWLSDPAGLAASGQGVLTLGSVMSMAAAGSPGGLHDQLCDLVRVGDQRQVAGIDLDRRGVHAVGKEALKLGRRGAILPGDGIPGGL